MSVLKRAAGLASTIIVLFATAFADGGAWRVEETSGSVRIAQTMAGVQLVSTGESLSAGSVLTTGLDGRAVLARGEQTIVVGPNSRMALPAVEDKGMTRILQDLGTLMFKVDKQEKQHFRVETPVIAAVVKGTTFTVTAGAGSHAVHVAEGLVEVTSLKSGESTLVPAGETVQVSTADYTFLAPGERGENGDADGGALDIAPAEGGKRAGLLIPSDIGLEPIDYAGLTGGLVRPSAGTPTSVASVDFNPGDLATAAGGVQSGAFDNGGPVPAGGAETGGLTVIADLGGDGLDLGLGAGSGIDVGASVGSGGVNVGADVGGVGATAGLDGGGVDVGASVGDAIDVGANVGAGGVDVGADVGGVSVDAGVGAGGIDVGADVGGVADVGAGVDSGGVGVDVGVGDGIDVGADIGGDGVDVDLGAGGLDVGVELGEDGLDIDLGLGDEDSGEGGLLGGLLNL